MKRQCTENGRRYLQMIYPIRSDYPKYMKNYKSRTKQPDQSCLRQWHPTPVLLPGKSHGRRSLIGCSPWGRQEVDTTERLPFHFSLSCIGEGNGNPLQCSWLENPRDGGIWGASVYGVAQSPTRLKRLGSSSSSSNSHQLWVLGAKLSWLIKIIIKGFVTANCSHILSFCPLITELPKLQLGTRMSR